MWSSLTEQQVVEDEHPSSFKSLIGKYQTVGAERSLSGSWKVVAQATQNGDYMPVADSQNYPNGMQVSTTQQRHAERYGRIPPRPSEARWQP